MADRKTAVSSKETSAPRNHLSTTAEDRTRVIVSACESSSSCHESRADGQDVAPSPGRRCLCPSRPLTANRCAPFRRRVSFSDATVIGTDGDDELTSACRGGDREIENKAERETAFYDIWQADDSSAGRSDDGYSESTPGIDNYAEDRCGVSGCSFSSGGDNKGRRSPQSENIGERTVESDGPARGEWPGDGDVVCPADRLAGNKARDDEGNTAWNEDLSDSARKNVDRDEYRMRGGCGGCCCGARENVWRSSRDHGCCCGGLALNDSCAPSPDKVRIGCVVPSRSRCRCPRVCKKAVRCEPPPCTTDVRSCGGGGCCGGYGTPGQICAPSPRICNSPAHSSRGRSCCASRCAPQPPCSIGGCRGCCGGPNYGRLPREPPSHLEDMIYGCCIVDDGARCGVNEGCCALKLHLGPLKCLGGGRDCRRCGRKVYQAEMQTASGVPYHNSCFSCFCCRKPLEPLTYQENSGEIYCKQCYVRNFGPQGYGYGVLQTPL